MSDDVGEKLQPVKPRMGRPPKAVDDVSRNHLGVRLTDAEKAGLDGLVAAKLAELAALGVPATMTASDYVRWLIRREAGLLPAPPGLPKPAQTAPIALPAAPPSPPRSAAPSAPSQPPPEPAPTNSRPPSSGQGQKHRGPEDEALLKRAEAWLAPGGRERSQNRLALLIGWDTGNMSRWRKGKVGIYGERKAALERVLTEAGL